MWLGCSAVSSALLLLHYLTIYLRRGAEPMRRTILSATYMLSASSSVSLRPSPESFSGHGSCSVSSFALSQWRRDMGLSVAWWV